MIRLDVEQGTRAWLDAKVGIPSASNFHRIITPKTLKLSSSVTKYRQELLAELALGMPLDDATTEFMQRGTLQEKAARDWYSLQRDCDVEKVGFLLRDDRRVGCSPDGLVGADGGLEIKTPAAKGHLGHMLGDSEDDHRCQVQGAMWLTGRAWWDLVSYNPDLPPVLRRYERDEKFIAAMADCVEQFLSFLDEGKEQLQRDYGLFEEFRRPDLKVVA